MSLPIALTPAQIRPVCDVDAFTFTSTAELPDLPGIIGQTRALRALQFGMGMAARGYNIFVLGPAGTGKSTAVRQYIQADAARMAAVGDWIYVHNFEDPSHPNAMLVPSGKGRSLRTDLDVLVKELQRAIPAAFESEDYIKERDKIIGALKEDHEARFRQITEQVEKYNFSLIRLPGGFMLTPVVAGKPITDAQFEQLTDEQRDKLHKLRERLQAEVDLTIAKMRQRENQANADLASLDESVARLTIQHPLAELHGRYDDLEDVRRHLDAMTEDLIANVDAFKGGDGRAGDLQAAMQAVGAEGLLRRYSINLFVDNSEAKGAPVVYESNPNFANLVGRVEHQAVMGALFTDFTMVRPGALHRANGGYLVLDATAVLERPQAWDALKRALKERVVRVEEYAQSLGLISTSVLEPEPIPLDVKVVLSGSAYLYYLLSTYDEDFEELFKVQADFDERMPRDAEHIQDYAQFIATLCRQQNERHFTAGAVASVVDFGSRLVADQRYLSTRFRDIADLVTEASYWARQSGRDLVSAADVQQAIDEKRQRGNRYEEWMREETGRGLFLVSVQGERVGQVNGLSVLQLGNSSFGIPSRITARTFIGRGGVIDIEREAKLSGPIHSKAVMILSSFLSSRYARQLPLSLHATLVFEQSYAGVEGDSASMAELCVLLSAIADLPVRQDFAITGSINQHGDAQPIGGVNEKVEGFFDTCRSLGPLTGSQGVILPQANIEHLVLRQDVVEAVRTGSFHLYGVGNVDQALELLTGLPIGEPDETGDYPEDSINGRVMAALHAAHARWQELQAGKKGEDDEAGETGAGADEAEPAPANEPVEEPAPEDAA